MNTCPKCGANVEAGSNFCTECGAPIVNDDDDTIVQMEDDNKNDSNSNQNSIKNIVTSSVDNVSIDSAKDNVINPTDEHHKYDVKPKPVPIINNTQPLAVTEQLAKEERYQEDIGLKQKFLRWDGRLSRKQFIIRQIQLELVMYACLFVVRVLFGGNAGEGSVFFAICVLAVCGARMVLGIFVAIRRMHDLDLSGRKLLWCLLELPILYYAYLTIFKKGTTGANQYGPDPLM